MKVNSDLWYVYLLRRIEEDPFDKDGQGSRSFYVGISNNLTARLKEHNNGKNRSTKGHQWELIAYLNLPSQRHCAIVERWLKTGDSRDKRLQMLELFQSGEHSGLFVDAFASRAYNWFANRQKKGKV